MTKDLNIFVYDTVIVSDSKRIRIKFFIEKCYVFINLVIGSVIEFMNGLRININGPPKVFNLILPSLSYQHSYEVNHDIL